MPLSEIEEHVLQRVKRDIVIWRYARYAFACVPLVYFGLATKVMSSRTIFESEIGIPVVLALFAVVIGSLPVIVSNWSQREKQMLLSLAENKASIRQS